MFNVLSENNIIDKPLLEKLTQMAKFRNLLVHRYEAIETKKLYQIINKDLGDISQFLKAVFRFLGK